MLTELEKMLNLSRLNSFDSAFMSALSLFEHAIENTIPKECKDLFPILIRVAYEKGRSDMVMDIDNKAAEIMDLLSNRIASKPLL